MQIQNINQTTSNSSINYTTCLNSKNNRRQTSFGSDKDLLRIARQFSPSKTGPILEKAEAEGNYRAIAEHFKSVYENTKNWLEKAALIDVPEEVTGNHHRIEAQRPKERIVLEYIDNVNNPQICLSEAPEQDIYNPRCTHFFMMQDNTSSGKKPFLLKRTNIYPSGDSLLRKEPIVKNLDLFTNSYKRFRKVKFEHKPE